MASQDRRFTCQEGLLQQVLAGGNTLQPNNEVSANCSRYKATSAAQVLRLGKSKNLKRGTFGLINHCVSHLSEEKKCLKKRMKGSKDKK